MNAILTRPPVVGLPTAFDLVATDEDIRLGTPGSATMCALARAAKRQLGLSDDPTCVTVCAGEMSVWNGWEFADYDIGVEAQMWTDDYDTGFPVRPATFHAVLVQMQPMELRS